MQPTYEVRQAMQQDVLAAAHIRQLAFPDKEIHRYENNIVCSGTINAVAVKGDVVVGFVSALVDDAAHVPHSQITGKTLWMTMRAYIAFLAVHPDHRRHGIGTSLLERACEAIFRLTSHQQIYLECEHEMIPYYERRGFHLVEAADIEQQFRALPEGPVLRRLRAFG